MDRTLVYLIAETKQIGKFLKAKGYSDQNLVDLRKDTDAVLCDGRPARLVDTVCPGSVLTVHIREKKSGNVSPTKIPLQIIYEDEDLVVVHKPAQLAIHPSRRNASYSIGNAMSYYFRDQPFVFRCTNRLDQDTSGLTIVAKNPLSAGILSEMSARKEIRRTYLAITSGVVTPSEGTIDAPIGRCEKASSDMQRFVDYEHGQKAVTHYRLLASANGHSLVELTLDTGRTHQIRVHMKYIGYPLIGDYLYNPDMTVMGRQALHAYSLRFSHPVTGAAMEFTDPLPDDMQKALIQLGMENAGY